MTPPDFRNENFAAMQRRFHAQHIEVYAAWQRHGPGTTRQVAERSGIDLLTLRPRSTELFQLGALCLTDAQPHPREGTYRARNHAEWSAWFETQRDLVINPQLQML